MFDVEVLTNEEAEKVKEQYIKRGWFAAMEKQINISTKSKKGFSNYKGVDLFNVRFKPNNYKVNTPYIELPKSHPVLSQSRYSFGRFEDSYSLPSDDKKGFEFVPGNNQSSGTAGSMTSL